MKKLELDVAGLEVLKVEEAKIANGGWLKAIVTMLVASAIDNWGDIKDGFSDGYSGKPQRH